MAVNENAIRLIGRLLRSTVEGKLAWRKERHASICNLSSPGNLSSAVYVASWEEITLRLYRVKRDVEEVTYPQGGLITISEIVLEFIDADGDSVREIKNEYSLENLFDVVRTAVSGLQQRVDKFMSNESVIHG